MRPQTGQVAAYHLMIRLKKKKAGLGILESHDINQASSLNSDTK